MGLLGGAGPLGGQRRLPRCLRAGAGDQEISGRSRKQTVDRLLQVSARRRAKDAWARERGWWACDRPNLRIRNLPFLPDSRTNWATLWSLTRIQMGLTQNHPRREVSGPPQSKCFADAFLGASWDAERFRKSMRRWVDFGMQYGNRQKNPEVRYSLNRLRTLVGQGKFEDVNAALEVCTAAGNSSAWPDR